MSVDRDGVLATLAAAVRDGRLSATQLTAEALARIEDRDIALRAVVARRDDDALAEAAAVDDRVAAGDPVGPLAGVPVLVKDLEDVTGMATRQGSLLFADALPARRDGLATTRLRAAGAVVVGKSALPEFALEGWTASRAHGTTHNPWDPAVSPGGSSGGSAAALSAGVVPVATATDGGGSARIPAAFCGLLGLKPTHGVIARRPVPDWMDLSTDGVMATTVADLALLLAVLAGPEPGDPTALPYRLSLDADAGRTPDRLLAAERTTDWGPLPAPVRTALAAAVEALEHLLGLTARWCAPPTLLGEGDPDTDWFTLAGPEHLFHLGPDRVAAGRGLMHPASLAFFEAAAQVSLAEYLDARRRRFSHTAALDEALGPAGLLVTPTVAVESFPADGWAGPDGAVTATPAAAFSTALQNLTGHPAITLPAGLLPGGLPFGVQVTGPRFADALLLDLARAWERAHPWPRTAPGYTSFDAAFGSAFDSEFDPAARSALGTAPS